MSRATVDDQLRFLLICVQYSNHGKVDFGSVAKECGVVSRGAAAKRYNRLLRNSGYQANGSEGSKPDRDITIKRKSKSSIAKAAEAKRRKIEGDHNDPLADDGGPCRPMKREPGVKQEFQENSLGTIRGIPRATEQIGQHAQQYCDWLPPAYQTQGSGVHGLTQDIEPVAPTIKQEDNMELHSLPSVPAEETPAALVDDDSIFDDFCTPELFTPSEQQMPKASDDMEAEAVSCSLGKATSSSPPYHTVVANPSPAELARPKLEAHFRTDKEDASTIQTGVLHESSWVLSAASKTQPGKVLESMDCVVILD